MYDDNEVEVLPAVELMVRPTRAVLQYRPAGDPDGHRWDQILPVIGEIIPNMKCHHWAMLDEPAITLGEGDGYTEYYVIIPSSASTWDISIHYRSPVIGEQAEQFLALQNSLV